MIHDLWGMYEMKFRYSTSEIEIFVAELSSL